MESLILVILVILTVVTVGLILAAYGFRIYHTFKVNEQASFRKKMLPLVYQYMDDGQDYDRFERILKSSNDLQLFAALLYELIDEFEGVERERLQSLLHLPALYKQKLSKLNSGRASNQIRACYYFGRLIHLRESVSDRIEWLLDSPNEYVSYAASSAMMASDDVTLRARALEHNCKTPGVSRLSIIELMYQFHQADMGQYEEEAEVLKNLIADHYTQEKARLVLIRGVADIGYHQLVDFLYEQLLDKFRSDQDGQITVALIDALGKFEYGPLTAFLSRFGLSSPRGNVRLAAVLNLAKIDPLSNVELFVKMLDDKSSRVRIASAYALAQCGREGLLTLSNRMGSDKLSETVIRRIVQETGGIQYVG